MTGMNEPDVACFGPYAFDASRGELRRNGQPIPLPPRASSLLELLIRHAGRTLLRDEILDAVWGRAGRVSADARLNSCVRRLRRALEDDAQAPLYIETVHRRGYRFVAKVQWEAAGDAPRSHVTRGARAWLAAIVVAGASVSLAILFAGGNEGVPEGWESTYLRGRHLATQGSVADVPGGQEMLSRVTEVAPGLSGAWSALGVGAARLGAHEEADQYARRALALSPTSAEAHIVLAETAIGLRWDLHEAEAHVLRAVALDPRSAHAHSTHAYTLALQGRWDEAIAQARRALALDPLRTLTAGDLAFFLYWARRYDEAIEQAQRILAVDPDFRAGLGALRLSLLAQGDVSAAAGPTLELVALSKDDSLLAAARNADPVELQRLYLTWKVEAASRLAPPERWMQIAGVRAEMGDLEGAGAAAQNALSTGASGLPMLLVDPRFDALAETGSLSAVVEVVRGAT